MDKDKWIFTEKEKKSFIDALTDELSVLRARASISQDELAKLVGISRQTYGAIERKNRRMSWNTYLSLILFFDYNESTHEMIRNIKSIPPALINNASKELETDDLEQEKILDMITKEINQKLDERALHAIKTVVMMEYARCMDLPNEIFLKTIGGKIVTNKEGEDK
jgi:DNA-binding XRE family transcriptional regulator